MEQAKGPQIFTVSELAQMTGDMLSECFGRLWLTGEISNLAKPASGHSYFTLKDDKAQMRVVLFRGVYAHAKALENGMAITIAGEMNLYAQRGELQIIARQVMTEGDGPLAIQFERLKQYCSEQGWFSAEHKLALPATIRKLGVVTSATGAALYDVLKVLGRRDPSIEVVVYPSQVQGDLAPGQLIKALKVAQEHAWADVILLTRGGGSAEDLFCFNDVKLVKAIYDCVIPLVSAVGHEVDTLLSDWVADVRAATPSAGAELLSQDRQAFQQRLLHDQKAATHAMQRRLYDYQARLKTLKMACKSPITAIQQKQAKLQHCNDTLQYLIQRHINKNQQRLQTAQARLKALNPKAILERGFAMITDQQTGKILSSTQQVKPEQAVAIEFSDGQVQAIITE
jgi:exodeoxyribonuclease VII large subunit